MSYASMQILCRRVRAVDRSLDRARRAGRVDECVRELSKLKELGAGLFAKERGWRKGTAFDLDVFAGRKCHSGGGNTVYDNKLKCTYPFDHCDYFREARRPYRPIAVVSHPYASRSDLKKFQHEAALYGLQIELLDRSWYSPSTIALLYTHDPAACQVKRGNYTCKTHWATRLSDTQILEGYRL